MTARFSEVTGHRQGLHPRDHDTAIVMAVPTKLLDAKEQQQMPAMRLLPHAEMKQRPRGGGMRLAGHGLRRGGLLVGSGPDETQVKNK